MHVFAISSARFITSPCIYCIKTEVANSAASHINTKTQLDGFYARTCPNGTTVVVIVIYSQRNGHVRTFAAGRSHWRANGHWGAVESGEMCATLNSGDNNDHKCYVDHFANA